MVVYDNIVRNEVLIQGNWKTISVIDLFAGKVKVYTWPLGNNRSKNKLQQSQLNNYIKRKCE